MGRLRDGWRWFLSQAHYVFDARGSGNWLRYFYGCYPQYANQTVSHFSSNQGGLNLGTGLTHNIGSGAKIYAEARYLWVNSPGPSATQVGSGTVSMIPVTFGIRF